MQFGSWIYVIYSQVKKHYDSDFLTVSLVTGKYLYLSDWVLRVIERVNIDFSSDREILLAGALDFVDLKAVTIKKKKSKHQEKAILWTIQIIQSHSDYTNWNYSICVKKKSHLDVEINFTWILWVTFT